jgi:hypothetical protein
MVDGQGQLRLVDLDSAWIPSLSGQPAPTESGHGNYQHPGRSASTGWGLWVDTFSALVIYLSLIALAKQPSLWLPLYSGENLLFERRDFYAPFETDAWKRLADVGDPEVDQVANQLKACCAPGWVATTSLDETLVPRWWQQVGTPPASGTTTSPAPGATTSPAPGTITGPPPTSTTTTGPPPAGATGTPPATGWQYTPSQGTAGTQPTVSLPPPPSTTYQAPVQTPPSTGPLPVTRITTTASGQTAPWWQQQAASQVPGPPSRKAPPPGPPRKVPPSGLPQRADGARTRRVVGLVCAVIALCVVIAGGAAGLGGVVAVGLILGLIGLGLTIPGRSQGRTPPPGGPPGST